MSKRKRKVDKNSDKILILTGLEATRLQNPHYNGFAGGYGPHKNKKAYCRKQKYKKDWGDM